MQPTKGTNGKMRASDIGCEQKRVPVINGANDRIVVSDRGCRREGTGERERFDRMPVTR